MVTTDDTVQVLTKQSERDVWKLLQDDEITILEEDGTFFLRASINHFSKVSLGKDVGTSGIDLQNVKGLSQPWSKEIQFVNATNKTLYFLVIPTITSVSYPTKIEAGLGTQVLNANVARDKRVEVNISPGATRPQCIPLPRNNNVGETSPEAGVICPSLTVQLLACSRKQARVVLMTESGSEKDRTLKVWDNRIINHRTRVTITQDFFLSVTTPMLGEYLLKEQTIEEVGIAALERREYPDLSNTREEEKDAPSPEEG